MNNWVTGIPTDNKKYLATFINSYGFRRTVIAFYAHRFEIESDGELETYDEYSESNDRYYQVAGWYEAIENWGDFSSIYINEGVVTHYQPLPEPPEDKDS